MGVLPYAERKHYRMDINRKFEEILLRNRIIKETSCDKAVKAVKALGERYISGSRIGIYGVGIEAESLLNFISKNVFNLKIFLCFDKTIRNFVHKDIIQNKEVYPIEQVNDFHIDYMIIGSYAYREVFVENLLTMGYQGHIVDLYSYMNDYIEDHFSDYKKAYQIRQAYLNAGDHDKYLLLQKLIKEYLLLKDFKYSFNYIDIYIENKYPDYERYIKLKNEIKVMLKEIKEYMKERKQRDIIINWVDAISYFDVPRFPFLQKKSQEGVCFQNAYTVMPWTTETTKTILFGEYSIEGKLFLRNKFSINNVKLLKILADHGYKFVYCGMPKFAKLFDETVIAPVCCIENKYSGSMQKQWDALAVLCESSDPICALIHTLRETHEPFICGECETLNWYSSQEIDWAKKECRDQAEIAGKYIDTQLEFYENFYSENAIEIYMSDHGRNGNNVMSENKIHTMLTVSMKDIVPAAVGGMFSMVCFPDLIKMLIEEKYNWNGLEREYILIENLDAYNELAVRDTLLGKLKKKEMYQCRGIVTKTDAYFKYAYGKEYYFEKTEPDQNKIDKLEFGDRIKKLKELCGNQFIDIYAYDKFKFSRLLYQ